MTYVMGLLINAHMCMYHVEYQVWILESTQKFASNLIDIYRRWNEMKENKTFEKTEIA